MTKKGVKTIALIQDDLPDLARVQRFWKRNGLKTRSIAGYSRWVACFFAAHQEQPEGPVAQLTARGVRCFAERYARQHRIDIASACLAAHSALRAWSEALSCLGVEVPRWQETHSSAGRHNPVLEEYLKDRSSHLGVNASRERRDLADLRRWFGFLNTRHKPFLKAQIKDVDDYLVSLRTQFALATICNRMTAVRQFLRFLYVSGRLRHNLAQSIQTPQRRRSELPRALPWPQVRQILRQVDRKTSLGQRDYAVLLLMSTYGLGAAEVIALTVDDLDWVGRTLTIARPKTGNMVRLPFLPAAARAVAVYLRRARPVDARTRAVFIRRGFPHEAFTSSVIRYMVRKYAGQAGIQTPILGAHVLRHSFACRQIDQHAPPRVLSDILGHRDPESTSVYTRVAVERLRAVTLPIPR